MDAALQHFPGTMAAVTPPRPVLATVTADDERVGLPPALSMNAAATPTVPREFFIQGVTLEGKTFRPSDWAERLAGAMSCFRPGAGSRSIGAYIGYSPYCVPTTVDGIKAVFVNEALRGVEPMAWDFVMNFARDNHLKVIETSTLPAAARA
jgi:Protein of unknown function (DUF3579)